jgi:transaldolase/glucose-6-phosphate isomerase
VASKSGGTAEVNAFLEYFWKKTKKVCGIHTGDHFVAITDPGTSMENTALARGFRKVFLADPTVGGRYSALTIFGLLPAGLIGLDLDALLDKASAMKAVCMPKIQAETNPGLVLGALLGQAALSGKDKLSVICDPGYEPFADWLEQLVAESSGKQGRGIVPIVREKPLAVKYYGEDRLFVYLRHTGKFDPFMRKLQKGKYSTLVFPSSNPYDLGSEFYRWEIAVAVACAIIRVNAFDQPDVQDNKTRTVQKMDAFKQTGKFDEGRPDWDRDGLQVFASGNIHVNGAMDIKEVIQRFLASSQKGDYIAINSYLPYDTAIVKAIDSLRIHLQKETHLATTRGFGPRFLHSTGQIHKGGSNKGLFIQITALPKKDLPSGTITFGQLERAQALGDFESLQARNRRIIRLEISRDQLPEIVQRIIKG